MAELIDEFSIEEIINKIKYDISKDLNSTQYQSIKKCCEDMINLWEEINKKREAMRTQSTLNSSDSFMSQFLSFSRNYFAPNRDQRIANLEKEMLEGMLEYQYQIQNLISLINYNREFTYVIYIGTTNRAQRVVLKGHFSLDELQKLAGKDVLDAQKSVLDLSKLVNRIAQVESNDTALIAARANYINTVDEHYQALLRFARSIRLTSYGATAEVFENDLMEKHWGGDETAEITQEAEKYNKAANNISGHIWEIHDIFLKNGEFNNGALRISTPKRNENGSLTLSAGNKPWYQSGDYKWSQIKSYINSNREDITFDVLRISEPVISAMALYYKFAQAFIHNGLDQLDDNFKRNFDHHINQGGGQVTDELSELVKSEIDNMMNAIMPKT